MIAVEEDDQRTVYEYWMGFSRCALFIYKKRPYFAVAIFEQGKKLIFNNSYSADIKGIDKFDGDLYLMNLKITREIGVKHNNLDAEVRSILLDLNALIIKKELDEN